MVAKSFARIHAANLINSGILPLTFANEADYDQIDQGDELEIAAIRTAVEEERPPVLVNKTKGVEIPLATVFTDRQKKMILAGGLLNATKNAK